MLEVTLNHIVSSRGSGSNPALSAIQSSKMHYLYKLSDPYDKRSTSSGFLLCGTLKECIEVGLYYYTQDKSVAYSIIDSEGNCIAGYGHKFNEGTK